MVDTSAGVEPSRPGPDPIVFARVHIFALPLDLRVVAAWGWPCLNDFLLIRPVVGELCVTAKPIFILTFLPLLLGSVNPMESVILQGDMIVRQGSRN